MLESKNLATKTIRGSVTDGVNNLPFALVKVKALNKTYKADYYGKFSISVNESIDSLIISAWSEGYYNGQAKALPGDSGIVIKLNKLFKEDNAVYQFISPFSKDGNALNCQNCHVDVLMEQWKKDAHGQSAKNPFFHSLYYGTDISGKNKAGVGFKLDFPSSSGNCATCHIPGAAINNPYGVDPKSVMGVDTSGIHCDLCHKIRNVVLNSGQGITGTQAIGFLRPHAGEQIFFGPYIDVHEPDAYSPVIRTSEYCMPCHNAKFWGVPMYQSFNEWNESIYPQLNIHCQTCHMAPDNKLTNFAPGKGGVERDPSTIPTHFMPGSRDTFLLQNSVKMTLSAIEDDKNVKVQVAIFNDRTGHHVPTDSPFRNMILLIEARDNKNNKLEFISGEKVPFWGGRGEVKNGNYADLPGKGFAKVLQDFVGNIPAPHWRPANLVSDNRIPAMKGDTSVYIFRKPAGYDSILITSKLIFRRFFKKWMEEKDFNIPDIVMENESVLLKHGTTSVSEKRTNNYFVSQNFPNPFTTNTRFNINLPHDTNVEIKVFDTNGRLVFSEEKENMQQGSNTIDLNLSSLSKGIYYCSFKINQKQVANRKIIKYEN